MAMRGWVRMLFPMETLTQWSSLSDQINLATELFGPLTGEQKVAGWLAEQMRRVEDVDFAQEFAAHVQLPGVEVLDYAHRLVRTRHGKLDEVVGSCGRLPGVRRVGASSLLGDTAA